MNHTHFTLYHYNICSRIGLTLHRNKMRRCAASCDGGDCEAERLVIIQNVLIVKIQCRTYLQVKRTVIHMLGRIFTTGHQTELPLTVYVSVVVVSSFFFCWSPFHSQRLMFVLVTLYSSWTKTLTSAQHILFVISGSFS